MKKINLKAQKIFFFYASASGQNKMALTFFFIYLIIITPEISLHYLVISELGAAQTTGMDGAEFCCASSFILVRLLLNSEFTRRARNFLLLFL